VIGLLAFGLAGAVGAAAGAAIGIAP